MAKAVADALIDEGLCVKLMNLATNHRSDVLTEVLDAKALLFGSATLNNGMLPRMADLLTYMRGLKPTGKIAAAFGSFGWSGEAVKHMNEYLQDMKLQMINEGIRHQYVPDHAALHKCRELGLSVAAAVKDSGVPNCACRL
jgi:flavorubredoxin